MTMQCFKSDSDSLLVFDYEEINSEKLYSSFNTLILNFEEIKPKKHRRHYKTKHEHRRKSGHQKKKNTDTVSTKSVTHVERQDLKCIINTSVCDRKNSQSCNEKSSKDIKSKNVDRPVPHCLKQLCRRLRHRDSSFHRHRQDHHCKAGLHRSRDLNRTHNCMGRSKNVHNKRKHSTHEKRYKEKLSNKPVVPELVIFPKNQMIQNKPDYEDISTKSLDSYLEIPSSYKHVRNSCKEKYHESKLDSLIKRTKERERKLVEQTSKTIHCCTGNTEVRSCSEIDSQSTLVLGPRDYDYPSKGYSPNRFFKHSPCSPNYLLKIPEMDFELNIKHETMDIETYSPTQSPHRDIKIEPKKEKFVA